MTKITQMSVENKGGDDGGPNRRRIHLREISGDNEGPAMVSVALKYRGEAHKVRVHLITGDEDMRIANIIYDNGKSLLDYYRETSAR